MGTRYQSLSESKTGLGELTSPYKSGFSAAETTVQPEEDPPGVRPPSVFQEVLWNEYCVLFPDGTHTPFNDEVRYTNLKGFLRKRTVIADGAAEYAIQYGEARRGWHRHYVYLNLKVLAWFVSDPQEKKGSKASEYKAMAKEYVSRGKDLGSVHLDVPEQQCSLYINRKARTQFALSFDNKLLMMQAGTEEDARDWVVAIASCLYFCSPSFAELIDDCQRFFNAVPKSYDDGRLSIIEALDLLRAMGREATIEQVEQCAHLAQAEGRFDSREFAFLVRYVCSDVEPAGEMLRAFKAFDTNDDGFVHADQLVEALAECGVPVDEIEPIVRAAGATADGMINYGLVVHALYPNSISLTMDGEPSAEAERQTGVGAQTAPQDLSDAAAGTPRSAAGTPRGTPRASLRSPRDAAKAAEPVSQAERIVRERQQQFEEEKARRAMQEREDDRREQERRDLESHRSHCCLERQLSSSDSLSASQDARAAAGGGAAAQCAACACCAAAAQASPQPYTALPFSSPEPQQQYTTLPLSAGGPPRLKPTASFDGPDCVATPRSAAINADITSDTAKAATPRTIAGRVERARGGLASPSRGAQPPTEAPPPGAYTETPGRRPLNPGVEEEPQPAAERPSAAAGTTSYQGGQCHRI